MSLDAAEPVQVCRSCGGGAPVDVHFCGQCSKILTLGRHGDYFGFLGLPRRLVIDAAMLEQRFRALSRQFHPDYFYNATPVERRASLERSSYLNDAHRTLKSPVARVLYLLELEGVLSAAERSEEGQVRQAPPALLEEVFALNEELEEVRALRVSGAAEAEWTGRLRAAAQPIEAKRDHHEHELERLSRQWDMVADRPSSDAGRRDVLQSLRAVVLERNYITNLLETIAREAAGSSLSLEP